jgi:hypothetical protein
MVEERVMSDEEPTPVATDEATGDEPSGLVEHARYVVGATIISAGATVAVGALMFCVPCVLVGTAISRRAGRLVL